jgi:preprotein translocase SecE subunit
MTSSYRKDQGRLARTIAFWTLAILIFYGCSSLRSELASRFPAMGSPVGGMVIPVLGLELTPAFLLAAALFCTGLYFVQRWSSKPKNADLLIDTELELRKVTWPTYQEVVNSSLVVVFCVLFLMGFLAGADWFLARLARRLLLGEG